MSICINKFLTIKNILLLGLCIRLLVLVFYPDQNFPDAQGYRSAGATFFETGFISSHLHMPLYIIWTHLWGGGVWLKITDILLSVMSIYLIYLLSLEIFENTFSALISALIAAIYPHFAFYSVSCLTETSFITLVLGALVLLFRRKYLSSSILLILSVLVRPTLDLLNPILIFYFSYFIHRLSFYKSLRKLGIYALAYGVLMAPWWIHNSLKFHEFVRLNLGDGHILYSGNNPKNVSGGGVATASQEDSDLDMSAFVSIKNPIEKNRALKQAALKFIVDNPRYFIKLAAVKFLRFWRLWPYAKEYQDPKIILTSCFSYGLVLTLSFFFTVIYFLSYWRNTLPIYMFSSYLMFVHIVTISSIRYRLPIEPYMIIFSGFMINKFIERKTKKVKTIS